MQRFLDMSIAVGVRHVAATVAVRRRVRRNRTHQNSPFEECCAIFYLPQDPRCYRLGHARNGRAKCLNRSTGCESIASSNVALKDDSQCKDIFRRIATVPLQITPGCLFLPLPLACCPAQALSDPLEKNRIESPAHKKRSPCRAVSTATF